MFVDDAPAIVDDPCPHGIPVHLCDDLCQEWLDEPSTGPDGQVVDLTETPGARLALQCQAAGTVPELLSDADVLDVVEGVEQLLRWATGLRTRMLAEFSIRYPAGSHAAPPGADETGIAPVDRWLPDEVGMTLKISRFEALSEIKLARRFAHVLPDTLALLEQGRICRRRAEALAAATAVLPDDKAREVEATVLAKAPDSTPRQHRDRIRRAIARIDPDGEYRRHRRANTERRVSIRPLDDGMASLWFYGPAEQVEPSWRMIDRLARSLGPGDPRTLDQRRFDVAAQIMQGRLTVTAQSDVDAAVAADLADRTATGRGDGTPAAPPDVLADAVARAVARRPDPYTTERRPLVHVVVGLDTLLGGDRPAELVGHGPISAVTARAIAAGGVWQRLVTDPMTGYLLHHGRATYTPPAALADHVRARDQVCRGPGCAHPIRDLDHHVPFGGGHDGRTDEANLFGYSRHCHLLKDAPGWNVVAHDDRRLTWISPCGRRTTTEPYDYRLFTGALPATESDGPASPGDDPPPF